MERPQLTTLRAYAAIVDGERILLCRLGPNSLDPGLWTLPGGGGEYGESPQETLHREVMEETGLTVELGERAVVGSRFWEKERDWNHSVRFIFPAVVTGGTLRSELDGSTDLAEWVPVDRISDLPRADIVDMAMEAFVGTAAKGGSH
jgi:ADP-ribose pyrophosphatase YjhB (NUDIX family)